MKELRAKIKKAEVNCVFSEPQFEPAIVRTLIANSKSKSGVLDPLGFGIKPGPNGYFELMEKMANSLARWSLPLGHLGNTLELKVRAGPLLPLPLAI